MAAGEVSRESRALSWHGLVLSRCHSMLTGARNANWGYIAMPFSPFLSSHLLCAAGRNTTSPCPPPRRRWWPCRDRIHGSEPSESRCEMRWWTDRTECHSSSTWFPDAIREFAQFTPTLLMSMSMMGVTWYLIPNSIATCSHCFAILDSQILLAPSPILYVLHYV